VRDNGRAKARYQGYSLVDGSGEPVDAGARFLAKFGYAPLEVIETGGGFLAGPILGGETRPQEVPSLLRRVEGAQRELTPERARQLALGLEA
jgi:hypothetical protein